MLIIKGVSGNNINYIKNLENSEQKRIFEFNIRFTSN